MRGGSGRAPEAPEPARVAGPGALAGWLARHAALLTQLALLALAARSFALRWGQLTASPYPLGVDGYFYPIQLRSLLEHGHLAYPASPLAFWLMAPLAALTDPITGAKLGAALAGAAVVWPAYALGARLGPGRLAGLAAAVVAVSSTGSLMLTVDFVKNSFGVSLGLAALAALLAALAQPATRARWVLAALALGAAVLTHKMAAGLALLAGGPALAAFLWRRGGAARRWGLVGLLGALLALAIAGALAPSQLISPSQLALARDAFSGAWRWDAPALAVGSYRLPLDGEVWKGGVLCALAAVLLVWRGRGRGGVGARAPGVRGVSWALLGLGLVLAWPTLAVEDPQGLGFRLRLVAFVPMAAAVAVLVGAALTVAPTAARWRRLAPAALCGVVLAGWLVRAPARLERGVVYAHPAMVAAVSRLAGAVPDGELVLVSERHIAFMATWYARVATAVRPQVPPRHRWRLMPLAFIGERSPLARALEAARHQAGVVPPRSLHAWHRDGLVLVTEATWQWLLPQLPPPARAHYQAWRAL